MKLSLLLFNYHTTTMTHKITYQSDQKLHISKSPSTISWILSIGILGTSFLSTTVFSILHDFYFKCLVIISAAILSFLSLEDWEDIVLDRRRESVILSKSNIFDRFLSRISDEKSQVIPMHQVVGVYLHQKTGIKLRMKDDTEIIISKHSADSQCWINQLRLKISMFLHLEKVETCSRNFEWDFRNMLTSFSSNHNFFNDDDETSTIADENESDKSLYFGYRNAIKEIRPRS